VIGAEVQATIKGYLEGFIQGLVEERKAAGSRRAPGDLRLPRSTAPAGDYRPFHEAILPEGVLRINEFERSFSTKLGTTFEEVARIVGAERWRTARRGYAVRGIVSRAAIRAIERICNQISTGGAKRPWPRLVTEVVSKATDRGDERERTADLYLQDHDRNEK